MCRILALQIKIGNNEVDVKISDTNPSGWIPLCTEVGVETDSLINILIVATDVSLAVDDISLVEGVCTGIIQFFLFFELTHIIS